MHTHTWAVLKDECWFRFSFSFFRSSQGNGLIDWNSGVSVRMYIIRPSICPLKVFLDFDLIWCVVDLDHICAPVWPRPDPRSRSRSLWSCKNCTFLGIPAPSFSLIDVVMTADWRWITDVSQSGGPDSRPRLEGARYKYLTSCSRLLSLPALQSRIHLHTSLTENSSPPRVSAMGLL